MGRQGFGVGDYKDSFCSTDYEFWEDKKGMEIWRIWLGGRFHDMHDKGSKKRGLATWRGYSRDWVGSFGEFITLECLKNRKKIFN